MPAAPNEKPRVPRGKSVLALLRQGLTKQPEGKDWGQVRVRLSGSMR